MASEPKKEGKVGKRAEIDWEAIERDYRLGQLTVREIARRNGIAASSITRRAARDGWVRDLTDEVRRRTRAELLRNAPSATPERNTPTREDVDVAVKTNVQLVREHRSDIGANRSAVTKLIKELHDTITHIDDIEDDIIEATADDKDTKRRARMLAAVALPSRANVAHTLAGALKTLIPLERQAFNLSGDLSATVDPGEAAAETLRDLDADQRDALRSVLEAVAKRSSSSAP